MDASIGSLTTPVARERRQPDSVPTPPAAPAQVTAETARPVVAIDAQRSVERDQTTGSLVYRLVDVATGVAVTQTPSEARLRLRAYIDGVMSVSAPARGVEVTA
ncbi:MAG: hypothetical protein DI565_01340 [Ancylobacter novellus]|uniref:Flagellar protein FlaG n=1 Tax=Ancylobacter novellus TaxID=921 RepID=A0A2W5KWD2_ANCNO|nr:MAG: hypothetical protein DI565_01340 [Ancylobacter novellus]